MQRQTPSHAIWWRTLPTRETLMKRFELLPKEPIKLQSR